MKKQIMFILHTGDAYPTEKEARREAERAYGNRLSRLCHDLIARTNGRYGEIQEYIDTNLDAFLALKKFKDDIKLEEDLHD